LNVEFCCTTKLFVGMVQERSRLPGIEVILTVGAGVLQDMNIPSPEVAATNLLPSAEKASELQDSLGAFSRPQVAPESLDT
jgi:hypothetical protein